MTTKLQIYPEYKNNGPAWLGQLPGEWSISPMRGLFKTQKKLVTGNSDKYVLLSLTMGGVKHRDLSGGGKNPTDYESYQEFKRKELVICLFDYDVTPRTIGYIEEDGMLTGAYTRLISKTGVDSRYYYYLYLYLDERKELLHQCTGLRNSISKPVFWSMQNPKPSYETQKNIANFLDEKTKVIDELVAKKEKMIELLREKRAALITHTVTKGLEPKAKMKPSGVDWLGVVPAEWEKLPLKFLFSYQTGGVWGDEARNDVNDLICVRVADFDFVEFTAHSSNFTYRNLSGIKKELLLDKNSILLEKSGGGDQQPVGRTVRYLGKEQATCSNFIQKLQVDKKYNSEFIILLLSTLYFNGVTLKVIKKTTGIQNLDLPAFLRTDIFLPSKNEQKLIVDFVNVKSTNVIDSIKKINQQINQLNEYRSSLIYSVVTGKVKV